MKTYRLDEKITVWGQLSFELPDDSEITEEELKKFAAINMNAVIALLNSNGITSEYNVNLDTEEGMFIEDNNCNPTVELYLNPISGQSTKPIYTNIEGTPWEEEYNKRMLDT